MIQITDITGQQITLTKPASRIISLVPSQTHLLYRLGLDKEVVGITRFCKYPSHWKKTKTIVGGTKEVKYDRITALQPDLILANKEENTKEMVEKLREIAPVYVAEVISWEDNLKFIDHVGQLTGTSSLARSIIDKLSGLKKELSRFKKNKKILYFIWKDPWMVAGKNTFIDTMLQLLGFENLADQLEGRYPVITQEDLLKLQPEILLMSSEPFPFSEKHRPDIEKLFPQAQIRFVQGEPFTWFGAYPLEAKDYLTTCCQ